MDFKSPTLPLSLPSLMGIEETCYGIGLQCDKASYSGKKLLLPGLLDGMVYKLDSRAHS